jgi:hypothetical protein
MPIQAPSPTQTQIQDAQPTQPRIRPGPAVRCRAAKACRRCNELRVKCDASERGTPCTRCEHKNEPECKLIESRRGIYPRKLRRTTGTNQTGHDNRQESVPIDGPGDSSVTVSCLDGSDKRQDSGADQTANDSITTSRGEIGDPRSQGLDNTAKAHPVTHGEIQQQRQQHQLVEVRGTTEYRQDVTEGRIDQSISAMNSDQPHALMPDNMDWVAQPHPDLSLEARPEEISPSNRTDVSTSSYREISWATMFDHLLESRLRGEDVVEKGSITYLGESFPLAIVLEDLRGGKGQPRLHHPGPPCPATEDLYEPQDVHPPHMLPEEITFLEAKKAFELPDRKTLDALVDVFLTQVYSLYPVVNRQEFLQEYNAKRTPWILLHAVCFISATFCSLKTLHRAGYDHRRQARWMFYTKAKALFDVGYESNKIVVLQISVLMSFWGGGPNNYWNFYSWIGTGVTIAEALGCHRSLSSTNMEPQDRSLLKRIWWLLVLRDTNCSALVGRPFRVNLDHCDAEPLTLDDFKHDAAPGNHDPNSGFDTYQIEAMKLTLILRQIIIARFYPSRAQQQVTSSLTQMLLSWRAQLPIELAWSDESEPSSSILPSSLRVLYNHHMIMANLNAPPEGTMRPSFSGAYPNQSLAEETCIIAAQQIASTACSVVIKSDILSAPHELLHGIFIAAVTFYMQTKSPSAMNAQSGRSGLSNCQMVLHESRGSWDPSPWILQLLDKMLGAPHTSQAKRQDQLPMGSAADFITPISGIDPGTFDGNGLLPTDFDFWQSHPVLGDLFENGPQMSMLPMTPRFGNQQHANTPGFESWTRFSGA